MPAWVRGQHVMLNNILAVGLLAALVVVLATILGGVELIRKVLRES